MSNLQTNKLGIFPYYAGNLLWIKTKSRGLQLFRLNSIQKLLWYGKPADFDTNPLYTHVILDEGIAQKIKSNQGVRNIVLKYRQAGMSTLWAGIGFHDAVTRHGHTSLIIAHQDETTGHIFTMCRDFLRYLPPLLKPAISKNNQGILEFADPKGGTGGLNSRIITATAKNKNAGHGITSQTLVVSELSRWDYPEEVMTGINETIPSGTEAPGTKIVIESVANQIDDYFHRLWLDSRAGKTQYSPIFLPWYLHEEYQEPLHPGFDINNLPNELQEYRKEYPFLTNEQYNWYYHKYIEEESLHPGFGWKFVHMLYPSNETEAFTASGFCVFPEKALQYFAPRVLEPLRRGRTSGRNIIWGSGPLSIWEEPKKECQYFIGADVSRGTGRSESAFQVIRYPGYVQVAEYGDNTVSPAEYAHVLSAVGTYYNNAMIAVELENAGVYTNGELAAIYPSGNLYIWEHINKNKPADPRGDTGFHTNSQQMKDLLLANALEMLSADPPQCVIRSPLLLQQMGNFRRFPNGNISAVTGEDDKVLSFLITLLVAWIKAGRHDREGLLGTVQPQKPERDPARFDTWKPNEESYTSDWRYS